MKGANTTKPNYDMLEGQKNQEYDETGEQRKQNRSSEAHLISLILSAGE
jgi:hypothetical protein